MGKIFDGEINSVQKAIALIEDIEADIEFTQSLLKTGIPYKFPFGIWFRGHSNINYDLVPSIFRYKDKKKENYYDETNIFTLSSLRLPHHQKIYETVFDWLCFMQHYDVPTRILDWSESILVALYFAVKNKKNDDLDGEVVVINARTLNDEIRKRYYICTPESPDLIIRAEMAKHREISKLINAVNASKSFVKEAKCVCKITEDHANPVAVFPNRWNERMVFQSSVFTVHGGKIYHEDENIELDERLPKPVNLETINDDRIKDLKPQLLKYYKIPKNYKAIIRETLFKLGIHEGSLFPEMDHQGIYLKDLW